MKRPGPLRRSFDAWYSELGAGEIEGGAEPPLKTGDVQQRPGDALVIVDGPDTRADGTEAPPSTMTTPREVCERPGSMEPA